MRHSTISVNARQMAFCGLLAALAVGVMLVGTWFPAATFCCPVFASLLLIPVNQEFRTRIALCWYVAVALLSLILAADKEAAFIFVFLGYYPIVKPSLDRITLKPLRWGLKFLLFQTAVVVCYSILLFVLRMDGIWNGMNGLTAVLLVLGNVTFFLYDLLLKRLVIVYQKRLHSVFFDKKK